MTLFFKALLGALAVYFASVRYSLGVTLLGATLIWGISAALLLVLWGRWHTG